MSRRQHSPPKAQGAAYREGSDIERAIAEFGNRVEQNPDDGVAWEALGIFAYAERDFHQAQCAIERASALVPLSPRGQLLLARCYCRKGFANAASVIYRHLAALKQLPLDVLEPLAADLGNFGECELALNICRDAAARLPDSAEPLIGIVHYMRRLGRPPEITLPVMYRVHQLEPDNVEYRIALAWMLHESGHTTEGAHLLSTLSCEKVTCTGCLERLLQIFEQAGLSQQAAACRAQLCDLKNESPFGHESQEWDE